MFREHFELPNSDLQLSHDCHDPDDSKAVSALENSPSRLILLRDHYLLSHHPQRGSHSDRKTAIKYFLTWIQYTYRHCRVGRPRLPKDGLLMFLAANASLSRS